jgi:hypothetical protein
MTWRLRLPVRDELPLRGGRTARLASFFPLLAWDGSGWATDPAVRRGDYPVWSTSPTADFDARITAPRGLQVIATGAQLENGRWRARRVRDFAVAVGAFRFARTTVALPGPVRVQVAVERGTGRPLAPYLAETVRSLRSYARRYGPYPWPTYTLAVMNDFSGLAGFAYPTLGFIGDGSLVLVPHETAHQWFYSLVGNNQWRDPWVSEALATWAQAGVEGSLPSLLSTGIPAGARNRLGEPMSFWDGRSFEELRLGVYVQGVQALASLGPPAQVDCALRLFVGQTAYRIASPVDLVTALRASFPDAEAKLTAYGARF